MSFDNPINYYMFSAFITIEHHNNHYMSKALAASIAGFNLNSKRDSIAMFTNRRLISPFLVSFQAIAGLYENGKWSHGDSITSYSPRYQAMSAG